ncbi:MAG: hypothetical protein SNJ69_02715 [Chloroflexaceae bacterium]
MVLRNAPFALLALLLVAGLILAGLAHDAPLARRDGLLRADALSALLVIVVATHGLVTLARSAAHRWSNVAAAWLVAMAGLQGHLGTLGGLLALAGLLTGAAGSSEHAGSPGWSRQVPRLAPLGVVAGMALIGLTGGAWNYGAPLAGAGLNSMSFALILVAALLALDARALAGDGVPAGAPILASGCLYALARLFSLGPWNPGWLFAALLMGGLITLWGAWRAAVAPAERAAPWLGLSLGGMAIAGLGMGSAAGLSVAGYALLLWPALRLGLEHPVAGTRALWLLSAAVPLSGPFVAGWLAIAAAAAGGVPALTVALWLAALLAALPPARLACPPRQAGIAAPTGASLDATPAGPAPLAGGAVPDNRSTSHSPASAGRPRAEPGSSAASPAARPTLTPERRARVAAAYSAGLGLGAPLVLLGLLAPLTAQLQGGLTPFGEIVAWPWAGLIAFDTTRQPVATLPSVALAGLMLVLSALCWVALRLLALRER